MENGNGKGWESILSSRSKTGDVRCSKVLSGASFKATKKKTDAVRSKEVSGASSTTKKKDISSPCQVNTTSNRPRRSGMIKNVEVKRSILEREQCARTRKTDVLLDQIRSINEGHVECKELPLASLPNTLRKKEKKSSTTHKYHVDSPLRSKRFTNVEEKKVFMKGLERRERSVTKKTNTVVEQYRSVAKGRDGEKAVGEAKPRLVKSERREPSVTKNISPVVEPYRSVTRGQVGVKKVGERMLSLVKYDSSTDTASSSSSRGGDVKAYQTRRQQLVVGLSSRLPKDEEEAAVKVQSKSDDTCDDSDDDSDDDSSTSSSSSSSSRDSGSEDSVSLSSLYPHSTTTGGILRHSSRFCLSNHSSSSMGHLSSSFNRSQTRFSLENEVIEVPKIPEELLVNMFYDDEELAQFRYEAFCEKIGVDPDFDGGSQSRRKED